MLSLSALFCNLGSVYSLGTIFSSCLKVIRESFWNITIDKKCFIVTKCTFSGLISEQMRISTWKRTANCLVLVNEAV